MLKKYISGLLYSIIIAFELCTVFELTIKFNKTIHQVIAFVIITFLTVIVINCICLCCPSFNARKKLILAGIIPLIFSLFVGTAFLISHNANQTDLDAGKEDFFAQKNVMILVPHQDDEVLLCGGVIENYVKCGSKVSVVFSTSGDRYGISQQRYEEALNVMDKYGINSSNVHFLGYGDQWKNGHIYNADADKPMTSYNGAKKTFGLLSHPAFNDGNIYTRNNFKSDIKSVITQISPDVIYCIDCDAHSDHIGTSLLFDEAIGELLKTNSNYHPVVYKGFAYSTALNAVEDYTAVNTTSTKNPYSTEYMQENNVYNWTDRVRIPVCSDIFSSDIQNNGIYRALKLYASQKSVADNSVSVINGDKVFWQRSTESLLYNAEITASSGNVKYLNDFKICDSDDVTNFKDGFTKGAGIWTPAENDTTEKIRVSFSEKTKLTRIYLYDNPSLKDNILDAEIKFSDGTTIQTGKLNPNGSKSIISFNEKNVSYFDVYITKSEGNRYGLTEIEAYNTDTVEPPFIKLMNSDEDFICNYVIDDSGKETLKLYKYGLKNSGEKIYYKLDNKKCSAELSGDSLTVTCPPGETCHLTVGIKNTSVSDTVFIMNPDSTKLFSLAQKIDEWRYNIFNTTAQKRYIKNLIVFIVYGYDIYA